MCVLVFPKFQQCGAEGSCGKSQVTKAAQFGVMSGKRMCKCVCTRAYVCAFRVHRGWSIIADRHAGLSIGVNVMWVKVELNEMVSIPSC